ncbi:HNH endonuclease signature motif containing protein [Methylocystis sp. JAN1]|uniref:HNH endonuclease signature motif containing protein n=1 Tax=Methylocystis sp. JAN1 TaxID=3397211 RepID=UPI003FA1D459
MEIEELLDSYRFEKTNPDHHRSKALKTKNVRCEALDLSGKPVEGDCVVCVSHSSQNGKGYTKIRIGDGHYYLHRLMWEVFNGCEIPEGYEVDHICRNRACINPKHLQVLSGESHRLKTLLERGKLPDSEVILLKKLGPLPEAAIIDHYEVWTVIRRAILTPIRGGSASKIDPLR